MRELDRILRRPALPQPKRQASLDLDFLLGKYTVNKLSKSFGDIITFTRPSSATRINPLGLIEKVAANVPCIDHDPINLVTGTNSQTVALAKDRGYAVTAVGGTVAVAGSGVNVSQMGAASGVIKTPAGTGTVDVTFTPGGGVTALHVREVLGLAVWDQRTNEHSYANDFTSSAWSKTACTPVPGQPGLDGTNSATKIVENTANSNHGFGRASWVDHRNGSACVSVYAKPAERTSFALWLDDGSGQGITAKFDLAAKTAVIVRSQAKFTVMKCAIYPAEMGFFRCVLAVKNIDATGVGTWGQMRLYLDKPGGTPDGFGSVMYAGDGTSGLIVQFSQLEGADSESPYIPTTTSQVTRAADVPVLNTLSPFYKQSEGAILVNFSRIQSGINSSLISPAAGSAYGPIYTNSSQIKSYDGTNAPLTAVGNQFNSLSTVTKVAVAYSAAGIQQVVDGVAGGSSNSFYNSAEWYNGTWRLGSSGGTLFRSIKYFPKRPSNAQLQSLTA